MCLWELLEVPDSRTIIRRAMRAQPILLQSIGVITYYRVLPPALWAEAGRTTSLLRCAAANRICMRRCFPFNFGLLLGAPDDFVTPVVRLNKIDENQTSAIPEMV